jgi:hypothetical protein
VQVVAAAPLVGVTVVVVAAAVEAHHTALIEDLVTVVIAKAEATRTTTSPATHVANTMPATRLRRSVAKRLPKQETTSASPPTPRDFAIWSSLRNSNLSGSPSTMQSKTQFSGSSATPYPLKMLVNNDTKCLYFPFCLDQAPLTWLESLDKNSIDEWDQLKAQFTSNFAGAMGCSGTRMNLAMVKQEQGKTLS